MMRQVIVAAVVFQLALAVPAYLPGAENKLPNLQSINELEAKASEARPRDRCFLYAKLVHQTAELSFRQYAAGNFKRAVELLKKAQQIARKIPHLVTAHDKRLKKAEIILSRTSFRLTQFLHASDYIDRPLIRQTIAEVNRAQSYAMLQVFRK